MFAKPTKAIQGSLAIDREVLILIANYSNLHARTIVICQDTIKAEQPRLQPDIVIIVHADPEGDESLRTWAREAGITVLPIFRASAGAMPPAAIVRQRLARELFTSDSFQITGPVSDDNEFFGRREQVNDTLRQLRAGRICALFGLRKVGKTSMINRIISQATSSGSPKVAMVDCSLRGFNEMRAQDALRALARLARLANDHGYAHISQTLHRGETSIMSTFDMLWANSSPNSPLLIVFDEIDYITPDSQTSPHWITDFNEFWRELRAIVQESRRQGMPLGMLVSGASSRSFRVADIGGVENSVLHFVPEDYLSPFADGAADAMIGALAKRCGLDIDREGRAQIATTCAYLPYWIRMAGSYIHRHVDIDKRPSKLEAGVVRDLCRDFSTTEGAEIARVALENLRRVDTPMFDVFRRCVLGEPVSVREARPLVRYGLVRDRAGKVLVESDVAKSGLALLERLQAETVTRTDLAQGRPSLELGDAEWAEELASISKRRNVLERKTRDFVRVVLRMTVPPERSWRETVLAALPQPRRDECAALSSDTLMSRLYWKELGSVMAREWNSFSEFFGDKRRLQQAFELLNDRPDAHAKEVDLADIALQRRELTWLEQRITQ